VFPVKQELGSYIPEDGILRSHRRENIRSYEEIQFSNCLRFLVIYNTVS
jgi:hypothetical protein